VEFDKAVSKIGEFERELNEYRRENHELKKTLGLVLEQEKFHKLHQKYLRSSHGKD
jgi:regulator of replication initiation timing